MKRQDIKAKTPYVGWLRPYIRYDREGPHLYCSSGDIHRLTRWERLLLWLGIYTKESLDEKWSGIPQGQVDSWPPYF